MIKFMVDSGSDYDVNEAKEKGIAFVPLSITFDNDTYKDGIEISRSEFYKRMREEDIFPKTAQPSPQAFLDVFEEAKANGDQIIGVMLSGGISGTYQSANIAKDMAEYDGIHLIDSKTAVYAIKIMVDYGMQLRDEGKTVDEGTTVTLTVNKVAENKTITISVNVKAITGGYTETTEKADNKTDNTAATTTNVSKTVNIKVNGETRTGVSKNESNCTVSLNGKDGQSETVTVTITDPNSGSTIYSSSQPATFGTTNTLTFTK